jgi:hypothetical protein
MKAPPKPQPRGVFSPVSVTIECVFFMKTMRPVDPCQLVREMCLDAQKCGSPMERKCKYINRLTPVMDTEKASEKGVRRVARKVLKSFFALNEEEEEEVDDAEDGKDGKKEDGEENPVEDKINEAEEVKKTEEEVKDVVAEEAVPETESQKTPFTVSRGLKRSGPSWTADVDAESVRHTTHNQEPHRLRVTGRHQDDCGHDQAGAQGQPQEPRQGHSRRDIPGSSSVPTAKPLFCDAVVRK